MIYVHHVTVVLKNGEKAVGIYKGSEPNFDDVARKLFEVCGDFTSFLNEGENGIVIVRLDDISAAEISLIKKIEETGGEK